jgi:hypothetical protein
MLRESELSVSLTPHSFGLQYHSIMHNMLRIQLMKLISKFLLPAISVGLLALPLALAQSPLDQSQPDQSQTTPTMPAMHAPIKAGGVMALDLPDSSAQSVSLDIVKGRFSSYSVGRVTLTGSGIDFRNGTLQGLKADIAEGDFENLLVDKLSLLAPAFSFDTMQLLNNQSAW